MEKSETIFPLEVKSGTSTKKKSLVTFGKKYEAKQLLRASLMNLKHDGVVYNYPLYLVAKLLLI